jgi:hypothetical protein
MGPTAREQWERRPLREIYPGTTSGNVAILSALSAIHRAFNKMQMQVRSLVAMVVNLHKGYPIIRANKYTDHQT